MAEQDSNKIEQRKKEFAVLRKYAAIQRATEDQIGCQKIYVDIAGGIVEAFVLDELIFFTLPRPETGKSGLRVWKEGMLWMAVSRSEWWDRKRITPKQADGAIERLVKEGLVFKDLFLFNKQKTTHLRLNVPEFFRRYMDALDKQNLPEDDSDTTTKDIADLYEMLGIPKSDTPENLCEGIPNGETCILKGDGVSPNGDSINSLDTPSTHPVNGANAPELNTLPIEWQIGAGVERVTLQDETAAKRQDMASLISMGFGANTQAAYELALTFQNERGITFTESDVKGQRKAIRALIEKQVKPAHISQAVQKLTAAKMTLVDMFGVVKTAVDIANQPTPEMTRLL